MWKTWAGTALFLAYSGGRLRIGSSVVLPLSTAGESKRALQRHCPHCTSRAGFPFTKTASTLLSAQCPSLYIIRPKTPFAVSSRSLRHFSRSNSRPFFLRIILQLPSVRDRFSFQPLRFRRSLRRRDWPRSTDDAGQSEKKADTFLPLR